MNISLFSTKSGLLDYFFSWFMLKLGHRNFHPLDPLSGYPLTLQNPPALLDLCRACNKVPAVLSILGDIRLGESPSVLCRPCWKNMGESLDENVVTLRIPDRSKES